MVKVTLFVIFLLNISTTNKIDGCRRRHRSQFRNLFPRKVIPQTRIIDGTPATEAQWPFVVSILYQGSHMCGGSIMNKFYVLTASHCFVDEDGILPKSDLEVSVGSTKWKKGKCHDVEKLILHEKYDNDAVINDIALLRVRQPFVFNSKVMPIRPSPINVNDVRSQIWATVIGWGFTNRGKYLVSSAAERLNFVAIRSIPWCRCRKYYSDIYETNLCMTGSVGMQGSCNGDSGGPLVTHTHHGLVQIGLVSYGDDCNNTKPEVYTRVPLFLDWIKNHMVENHNKIIF